MLIGDVTINRCTQIGEAEYEKDEQLYNGIFHFIPILKLKKKKCKLASHICFSVFQTTYHNYGGNMCCNQGINTTRCSSQENSRTSQRCTHRTGNHTSQIHQGHTPPMMHQFQCDTQENLYYQIHKEMHKADMHKHVCDKTPGFVTFVGIINEEGCGRTICTLTNTSIILGIISAKREKFEK